MNRTGLSLSAAFIFLGAGVTFAQSLQPLPGSNLALGKPATFSLEPTYALCKGGDETDLTDGIYWQPENKNGFWSERGTVGWSWGGSAETSGALITFDLEHVCAISAVGFDSASGASQVTFPATVMLYVSDDAQSWQYVADLINEAVPQHTFVRHRFVVRDLRTRGRYVGLFVVKGGFYAFVDEIEVMKGDFDPAEVTFKTAGIVKDGLAADAIARAKTATQKNTSLYYFTWKPAKGFETQAAAELERSYETAHLLHHEYMPWPEVDPQTKKLIRPLKVDFKKLDQMLAYRPYVRQWLLWPGFEFGYMSLNYRQATDMPAVGTPEHNEIFRQWVQQIRDHMNAKGLSTADWAFYWVDEPGDDSFLKLVVPASKLAKEVDPTILIWEDHQISLQMLEEHPDAIDIHCCPLNYYRNHPDVLAHVLAEQHRSWQYVCASSKANDPHRYYRLHHLASVELGLDGGGMWVWGDDGGQFNDYAGPHTSYGMVYATDSGPITGKRREAWREGIEDVELFRHLRTRRADWRRGAQGAARREPQAGGECRR